VVAPATGAGWTPAASLDDLPEGAIVRATVGDHELALVRHEGVVYALGNVCPHRGGLLSDGKLQCGAELACPLHGFRYDLRTGKAAMPPDVPGVRTYQVRVEGGQVLVQA
jgi:nitrite reductase/ring-hydroxylating ferredoxin subunit